MLLRRAVTVSKDQAGKRIAEPNLLNGGQKELLLAFLQ
jgi:hypothetical protein